MSKFYEFSSSTNKIQAARSKARLVCCLWHISSGFFIKRTQSVALTLCRKFVSLLEHQLPVNSVLCSSIRGNDNNSFYSLALLTAVCWFSGSLFTAIVQVMHHLPRNYTGTFCTVTAGAANTVSMFTPFSFAHALFVGLFEYLSSVIAPVLLSVSSSAMSSSGLW